MSTASGHGGTWVGTTAGRLAALALTLGALNAPAHAATVLKVDIAEATRLSEWVVRARVLSLAPLDLRASGDSIYTEVTLAIDAVYRGQNVPKTYVMRLMGGIGKDGMALAVPGMPEFKPGDDVVLFLEKVGVGHVPCGLGQGVWRVAPGLLGHPVVYRSLDGLAIMAPDADGKLVETHPLPAQGVKLLSQLVREIKAVTPR